MSCGKNSGSSNMTVTSLATPEPHYIPGYMGYLPQEKFRPGNTYGMASHRILIDPCVHMSPRSVLNNLHPDYCLDEFLRPGLGTDPFLQSQMALVTSRVNSLGRQVYQPAMTPGYTGFVPRFRNVLGHTYSPACNRAIATFEQEQWKDRLFSKELEALEGWRFCYKTKPWETPGSCGQDPGYTPVVTPPARAMPGCCSSVSNTAYSGSPSFRQGLPCPPPPPVNLASMPFNMNVGSGTGGAGCSSGTSSTCGNPSQFRILPAGRSVCDYPQRRMWAAANEPFLRSTVTCGDIIKRLNSHRRTSSPSGRGHAIYKHCEGMIPNYMGHVPGEQFRIGVTYGTATRNPKRAIQPDLLKPLCFPIRP